jgi:hypothetical protein
MPRLTARRLRFAPKVVRAGAAIASQFFTFGGSLRDVGAARLATATDNILAIGSAGPVASFFFQINIFNIVNVS